MKCDKCKKEKEGVKAVHDTGDSRARETAARSWVESSTGENIVTFAHLCPECYVFFTNNVYKK